MSFLHTWKYKSTAERQLMADTCMTTKDYLCKIAYGHREPSRALFNRMRKFDDSITMEELRQ